jgi:hypothetical protein
MVYAVTGPSPQPQGVVAQTDDAINQTVKTAQDAATQAAKAAEDAASVAAKAAEGAAAVAAKKAVEEATRELTGWVDRAVLDSMPFRVGKWLLPTIGVILALLHSTTS